MNIICAPNENKMLKEVKLKDTRLDALIATGSQVTIMRESVYKDLKIGKLLDTTICLSGFGKN